MPRKLRIALGVVSIFSLAATACGNSGGKAGRPDPGGPSKTAGGGGEAQRDTFKSISGVPGVSDDEIAYAIVGTKANNPLGTCILDCYTDGIKAYFAFRNSQGGIFGRDLVVTEELDDELGQNQARALELTSGKKVFGDFQATLLAAGWGDLDAAGVPTYTWGINPTEAANRPHIFPSLPIPCSDCTRRIIPYAAGQVGAKHAASLGYGISENSKDCTNAVAKSFEMYGDDVGTDIAYVNDNLDFGLANGLGPQVSAMKKAKVDFISTCIDLNGMKTLAQELDRQGMEDVVLFHPNSYDQAFIADAGGIFEGDFVAAQFRPFESDNSGTALGDFQTWMDKQGSQQTELAMVGWLNATLAYEGLLAAGPEFDQASVTDATNAITDFDADGLLQPIDWSKAHTPFTQKTRDVDKTDECGAVVQVKKGKFVTVAPKDKPWLCWDGGDLAWGDPVPTALD